MDSEGFCFFNKTILVSEEYVPELLQFDMNLILIKRWSPGFGLPKELSLRKANRGLEGHACDANNAFSLIQSPLKNNLAQDSGKIRLIQFHPITQKTEKQFFYPIQPEIADKLGDLTLVKTINF